MGEEHQTLITRFYKGYTWASSGFTCQYTPFVQDSRCNNSAGSWRCITHTLHKRSVWTSSGLNPALHVLENGHGHQSVAPCKRLALLFSEIQTYYKELGSPTRLTNLKISMFTKEKTPHSTHAFLTSKGAECKHLAPALKKVCQDVFDSGNVIEMHMITALESIIVVTEMFDKAAAISTTQEWCEMMTQAEVFLTPTRHSMTGPLQKGGCCFIS